MKKMYRFVKKNSYDQTGSFSKYECTLSTYIRILGSRILHKCGSASVTLVLTVVTLFCRNLQNRINEAIVSVQAVTANPKTDTRLGKVGR
jgi:hypothetical protein